MIRTIHKPGGMREMIAIAIPMVVAMACDTVMTFTDRVFLSRLGPEIMNAALGGGIASFMISTFFTGLVGYSTALVAQYLGAGRKNFCARVVAQALFIIAVGYPLIILCRPFAHFLFERSGISFEQLIPQKLYFNILIFGSVIGLLRMSLSSFFSGIGRTRVVMIAAFASMVANIFFNYVLIYGKLGLPAMGIAGAAYGTILGGCLGLIVLAAAYFRKNNRKEFSVAGSARFDREVMYKLLRYGYPAGLEMFLKIFAFNAIVMLFQSHSAMTATAVSIMFNWDMVSFIPLIGIGIGVTSLVGRAMGSGRPELAAASVISGLKLGSIYSAIILLLFVGLPDILVGVFSPSAGDIGTFVEAAPLAIFMIRVASLYVMVNAVIIVFISALRGAGDTFWAMCLTVGVHWVIVASLFLMLNLSGASPKSAWVVFTCVFIVFSFVVYARYRGGKWRDIKLVAQKAVLQPSDYFHEQMEI
ncbi:MAG TPA: MATE family efflux transporter [bacterium]|nr:MATE family efflux transporter [bacterium]